MPVDFWSKIALLAKSTFKYFHHFWCFLHVFFAFSYLLLFSVAFCSFGTQHQPKNSQQKHTMLSAHLTKEGRLDKPHQPATPPVPHHDVTESIGPVLQCTEPLGGGR